MFGIHLALMYFIRRTFSFLNVITLILKCKIVIKIYFHLHFVEMVKSKKKKKENGKQWHQITENGTYYKLHKDVTITQLIGNSCYNALFAFNT